MPTFSVEAWKVASAFDDELRDTRLLAHMIEEVIQQEREACAKVAETYVLGDDEDGAPVFGTEIGTAIRKRLEPEI